MPVEPEIKMLGELGGTYGSELKLSSARCKEGKCRGWGRRAANNWTDHLLLLLTAAQLVLGYTTRRLGYGNKRVLANHEIWKC